MLCATSAAAAAAIATATSGWPFPRKLATNWKGAAVEFSELPAVGTRIALDYTAATTNSQKTTGQDLTVLVWNVWEDLVFNFDDKSRGIVAGATTDPLRRMPVLANWHVIQSVRVCTSPRPPTARAASAFSCVARSVRPNSPWCPSKAPMAATFCQPFFIGRRWAKMFLLAHFIWRAPSLT